MLLKQDAPLEHSRAIPFVLGTVLALLSFAFFGWDLGHHWNPSPPHAPSPLLRWFRYFQYFWLLDGALRIWRRHKSKASDGWWPMRRSLLRAPDSDNLGAITKHPSESTSEASRR
jgi:hypothetical protein